jgi:hypothetical protein
MVDPRRALSPVDDLAGNTRTVAHLDPAPRIRHADFEALFDMHYAAIRREHEAATMPGVLSLAFDLGSSQLVGRRLTKARTGAIDAFTAGRHNRCELPLTRDPAISLRHLTLLVHPRADDDRIRFRLLDLRTQLGFQDCFGNRMQAVEADGPAMVAVGRYALLLLPTGSLQLPDDPRRAWDAVADPLYLEYRTEYMLQTWDPLPSGREPAVQLPRAAAPAPTPPRAAEPIPQPRTSFVVLDGPARPAAKAADKDAQRFGVLEVASANEVRELPIDAKAAERGLLIGSYDRCDDPCLTHLTHPAISRVHLLIIGCDGALFAVDTASSNGTFVETKDGRRVRARVVKLAPDTTLSLADSRARLHWSPDR